MRWRRFPFSSLPDPASGGVPLFLQKGRTVPKNGVPPFLFAFSPRAGRRVRPDRQEDSFLSLFSFFSFSLLLAGNAFLREDGFRCSVFSFLSFFGKNGGNVLPEKSKKDGGSFPLTTDSDSMAISFFSFSLLKGRQEDAFRRRDEKDSFPRRKTENGDPARKAVFLFSLFSEKDKKPSSGGEDEGGREKQENMPEG